MYKESLSVELKKELIDEIRNYVELKALRKTVDIK